jgi:hypothetical protein
LGSTSKSFLVSFVQTIFLPFALDTFHCSSLIQKS